MGGTGHLHDITVVTPTFLNGQHIGFFASTAHIVDIGGRGWGPDANSIYEEGLYIPQMRFLDRGQVNETLLAIIRANVREPDQLVGDVYALATCNHIGQTRLKDMMAEFDLPDLQAIVAYIFERSTTATLAAITALPQTSARHRASIDGYAAPIDLAVEVVVADDHMLCDFTGTSGLDPKGINVPLVYTKAYACYALKCAIAPDIPNNWASLRPFVVKAPENCILNALHPAPVALRHVIGHMIPDAVYGALDQILPHTVPAEGAGALCNFQVSMRPYQGQGVYSEVLTFNSGGSGARPTKDGMNTTAFPSGVMTMPVEATEQAGPVLIVRKELRPDSGGAGQYRGGLGQYMDVRVADGQAFDFSAMFDRVITPPLAVRAGRRARRPLSSRMMARTCGARAARASPMAGRFKWAFLAGQAMATLAQRDRAAVKRDFLGYISAIRAKNVYGLTAEEVAAVQNHMALGGDPDAL